MRLCLGPCRTVMAYFTRTDAKRFASLLALLVRCVSCFNGFERHAKCCCFFFSVDGEQVSCFDVSLSGKSQPMVFGAPSPAERHVWMRKILESVTPAFPPRLALDYSKAGWCYLKVGTCEKIRNLIRAQKWRKKMCRKFCKKDNLKFFDYLV